MQVVQLTDAGAANRASVVSTAMDMKASSSMERD
jgi:hypothetical protein